MAIYTTKRCPYCGYAYKFLQRGEQRKYGCPLQTCIKCHKKYWEPDIKEPALYGFNNLYEVRKNINRYITIVLYSSLGLLSIGGGIFALIDGFGFLIFILCILFGCFQLWAIFSEISEISHEKKNRHITISQQKREYDASYIRLQNIDYLTALAGYDRKAKKLLDEKTNGREEHYADPHHIKFTPKNNVHKKAIITATILCFAIAFLVLIALAIFSYIENNYDYNTIRNFWRRLGF